MITNIILGFRSSALVSLVVTEKQKSLDVYYSSQLLFAERQTTALRLEMCCTVGMGSSNSICHSRVTFARVLSSGVGFYLRGLRGRRKFRCGHYPPSCTFGKYTILSKQQILALPLSLHWLIHDSLGPKISGRITLAA